ncbi:MAG: hypothetical protein JNM18_13075 [Planctomycetaceae bacterium]|nr:hypothetical protein [Planctomycetaceae bacterium]
MRWYSPWLYLWASPATLLGLSVVPIVWWQSGSIALVQGVIEIHGGIVTRCLHRGLPWAGPAAAMTLGHVVWGCDRASLERTRAHERVHVRQYERWGPLFIPLYLSWSLWLEWQGRDPYRDNPFEVEAYDEAP